MRIVTIIGAICASVLVYVSNNRSAIKTSKDDTQNIMESPTSLKNLMLQLFPSHDTPDVGDESSDGGFG